MHKFILAILVSATVCCFIAGSTNAVYAAPYNHTADIVVQTKPGPTVAQKYSQRVKSSWPWYVARGSGFVAAFALILLMISGIGQVTGYTFRFLEPLTAWATHRALGLTFGVAVLIHMFSLLFDRFVPFSLLQLFVPWLSHYKPVTIAGLHLGSLYVALGVLAFYGVVLIILTSLLWVDKKPYTWKLFHLLSYLILVFVFIHALYLGTDLAHGFWRWLWIILALGTFFSAIHRLWRAKTI